MLFEKAAADAGFCLASSYLWELSLKISHSFRRNAGGLMAEQPRMMTLQGGWLSSVLFRIRQRRIRQRHRFSEDA
jgi:hypothetical protein